MRRLLSAFPLLALVACAIRPGSIVPASAPPGPALPPPGGAFEVVAHTAASVSLPLEVAGQAYGGLEPVLREAVGRAVSPRAAGLLTLDLLAADARVTGGEWAVSLDVRATLRRRVGNVFVAQTESVCRASAPGARVDGNALIWDCLQQVGQHLAGWLDGLPSP